MEYTTSRLAGMAGVSARTLRYYDKIGLLTPKRISSNGYRIYGKQEVDLLQQILFFKELGFELDDIKKILEAPDFDSCKALNNHLKELCARKERIEELIANVQKTISSMKGKGTMQDKEKFQGFQEKMIEENEQKYGEEIRAKYGNDIINASNEKFRNMTQEQYTEMNSLSQQINEKLGEAVKIGDVSSEIAQQVCDLHRRWICMCWPSGVYSKEAHLGLTEMYCADERFKAYYDAAAPGATEFLRDAMKLYYS